MNNELPRTIRFWTCKSTFVKYPQNLNFLFLWWHFKNSFKVFSFKLSCKVKLLRLKAYETNVSYLGETQLNVTATCVEHKVKTTNINKQQQTATNNHKQQQTIATNSNKKQQIRTTNSNKQQQTAINSNKKQQTVTHSNMQQQTKNSNKKQQTATYGNKQQQTSSKKLTPMFVNGSTSHSLRYCCPIVH